MMFPIASVKEHPNVELLQLSLVSVLSAPLGEIVRGLRIKSTKIYTCQVEHTSIYGRHKAWLMATIGVQERV